jgi:hypothetical protein
MSNSCPRDRSQAIVWEPPIEYAAEVASFAIPRLEISTSPFSFFGQSSDLINATLWARWRPNHEPRSTPFPTIYISLSPSVRPVVAWGRLLFRSRRRKIRSLLGDRWHEYGITSCSCIGRWERTDWTPCMATDLPFPGGQKKPFWLNTSRKCGLQLYSRCQNDDSILCVAVH